jgi:hypothetical protein
MESYRWPLPEPDREPVGIESETVGVAIEYRYTETVVLLSS